ncbi:MAG TPA: hypothetical protein VJ777_16200 [Mycobacterium sp.]|nr:hypothetical protein [Mycobacterium sp.]
MGKPTACSNNLLKLIFNATAWAQIADNAASPTANITVALHTADPGVSGTQSTSEANYTGYARVNVVRTTSGWTASSSASTSPVGAITFGACSAGSNTITYFSVGTGTGNAMLYSGTVTPNISVSAGVTPSLTTASTITES